MNLILDYELRVLDMLWYLIIPLLAVSITQWCTKSFSHSADTTQNFLYPTSYVYDPSYTKTKTKGEI